MIQTDIEKLIAEATDRLVEAAHPDKIILFGSYARGDFDRHSDLDFLVILPTVAHRFEETIRLQSALRGLRMAADIVVYSAGQVEERRNLRGTMLYHALAEGRVLYASPWRRAIS
jgi:predicted nucleotidyltransferase